MFLIDTHILLWWLVGDSKLPESYNEILSSSDNIVFLSAVSIWEITMKESIGKIEVPENFKEIVNEQDFRALSINSEHAYKVKDLPNIHLDPFDRLLIAQALVEDLKILTVDKNIKKYDVKVVD